MGVEQPEQAVPLPSTPVITDILSISWKPEDVIKSSTSDTKS
jgi:hypothetical protein